MFSCGTVFENEPPFHSTLISIGSNWRRDDSLSFYSKFLNFIRAVARLSLERRSKVQVSGRSNLTHCCQQLATAATFFGMELCCLGRSDAKTGPAHSLHASA